MIGEGACLTGIGGGWTEEQGGFDRAVGWWVSEEEPQQPEEEATIAPWFKFHLDLLGMAPENEGKPAVGSMGGRTEVSVDELLEIEQLMVKVQVQMEGICSSDLAFQGDLKLDSLDATNAQLNYRPDALKVFANKSDNVKICNELALLKLRNLIPRQKGSGEVRSSPSPRKGRCCRVLPF